jgi:hypothetical protein
MHAPYILKYIFDIFWDVKKLKQKIHTYIFTCYMPTKSLHDKSTYHVACVKKIKFGAKHKAFHMPIFDFLHRPQNVSVFGETLQTRLDCEYVNANFLSNFLTFRNMFFRGGICNREPNWISDMTVQLDISIYEILLVYFIQSLLIFTLFKAC